VLLVGGEKAPTLCSNSCPNQQEKVLTNAAKYGIMYYDVIRRIII
jgi:hypothetical protein